MNIKNTLVLLAIICISNTHLHAFKQPKTFPLQILEETLIFAHDIANTEIEPGKAIYLAYKENIINVLPKNILQASLKSLYKKNKLGQTIAHRLTELYLDKKTLIPQRFILGLLLLVIARDNSLKRTLNHKYYISHYPNYKGLTPHGMAIKARDEELIDALKQNEQTIFTIDL